MKILVVSGNYPSLKNPSRGVFVYNLIQQFARLGHTVYIISPEGILPKNFFKNKKETDYGKELGTVYRPKFLSASQKFIFGFNTFRIGEWGQIKAVKRTVKRHKIEFDVVYAHFLKNAFVAVEALSEYNKPIYGAIGEYNMLKVRKAFYSSAYFSSVLEKINGFIAVSPQVKERLIEYGVKENKIIIKPNAVNSDIFYPRNKLEMRSKYDFPKDKILAIFVGRFVENKGPKVLLEATKNQKGLGLIFVGRGPQILEANNIIFKDSVPSEKVPELLSAADLFVLPTWNEGSCNAIVEAMACGLPIISSDIPEIRFQCDPSFSILVDPLDVKGIESAIDSIISNEHKRAEMSKHAMEYAKKFEIGDRALSILNFIQGKSEE
ncbi:glycosyltransferase family 4 protein [uncultured Croceitalea sp.]|uniref:glycosyltransferase family 4 protein n=1 Tax=uncultured Croceitalea sp. TaxID=1798908 RepID=UPI0033057F85